MTGGDLIRGQRAVQVLAAIRAYEGVPALPTTGRIADAAGLTQWGARDVLSSLRRRGVVYSTLQQVDGRPQRVWRIKHQRERAAA